MDDRRLSKRLSYVLRHDPGSIGLTLDPAGWARLDDLLVGFREAGVPIDAERLRRLVARGPKQRFELDDAGDRIRARYGHSVDVDPSHAHAVPPDVLYHGTRPPVVQTILAEGLRPMRRQRVHLSTDTETAREVGSRRGEPVILAVDAGAMHREGHRFQRATSGVWLVDEVPARFLKVQR